MTDPPMATPLSPTEQLAEWAELVENIWNRCRTIGHQGEEFMWESDFECAATQIRDEVNRWSRPAPAPPEGELTDEELWATLDRATADFPPVHPEAGALSCVEYAQALELRKARAVEAAVIARHGNYPAKPDSSIPPTEGESNDTLMAVAHAMPFEDWDSNIAQIIARGLQSAPGNDGSTDWMENAVGVCLGAISDAVANFPPAPVPVDELMAACRSGVADAAQALPPPSGEVEK